MRYNYPIKYAPMPIIEQVGWNHGLHELEKDYDVVCYIVSKCFLLSDKTEYKENGKKKKIYEVVFPYQKREYYNFERVVPSFNIYSHECINSIFVEEVFDSYKEALEVVKLKNKKLSQKNVLERLYRYKMLEQQILVNTFDLDLSKVKELKEVIVKNNGKFKVSFNSIYEYLKYNYSKSIIYSITLEEYNQLMLLIKNKDISNILSVLNSATPILYCDGDMRNKNIMVIDENGNVLHYINEYGSLINDIEQKVFNIDLNNINDKINKVYTTETLEDILGVDVNECINLNELQGPVLNKRLY